MCTTVSQGTFVCGVYASRDEDVRGSNTVPISAPPPYSILACATSCYSLYASIVPLLQAFMCERYSSIQQITPTGGQKKKVLYNCCCMIVPCAVHAQQQPASDHTNYPVILGPARAMHIKTQQIKSLSRESTVTMAEDGGSRRKNFGSVNEHDCLGAAGAHPAIDQMWIAHSPAEIPSFNQYPPTPINIHLLQHLVGCHCTRTCCI